MQGEDDSGAEHLEPDVRLRPQLLYPRAKVLHQGKKEGEEAKAKLDLLKQEEGSGII